MDMLYIIKNDPEITVSQELETEQRQEAEEAGVLVASDLTWMLVDCGFETASRLARLTYSHPMIAKAGSFMDAGGQTVYIDDNCQRVENAVEVLQSLADNGDADAREFFESYTEDAYGDYADEILAIMGRAF
jgi:hypothetical protein